MKVDGSLKSLLQGISQQPPTERLPGQCTAQENFLSDPVSSLTRRPPTDLIGKLFTGTVINGWHHFITRDGNRVLACFHDGTVETFDLNAEAIPITIEPGAGAYLNTGKVRCATDEDDVTLIANQSKTPAMLGDIHVFYNTVKPSGIVQILGGQYGKKYTIDINGVNKGLYTTPDGSIASHSASIDTAFIANQLANNLVTNLVAPWEITVAQDIILISHPTDTFTITASDGFGNQNIRHMSDTVQDVKDLPRLAPHRYVARVAQKTDQDKDLWFNFVVTSKKDQPVPGTGASAFGEQGYWQECVAVGVPYKMNKATLPHQLKYDITTGEFTFSQADWADRKVGTLVSNPNPSFIGNPIQDIASFQGRGVMIAGNNVCMSRTNKYLDHWNGSASALADTDPIDINSTIEASNMVAVVQHNRDLVAFSNKAQFVVFGRQKVTPGNAALTVTTQFESESGAHPVSAGKNVFFSAQYGRYTSMREFFAEGNTDINDSRPITQHVKKYIDGTATLLTASSTYDMLMVHTGVDRHKIYMYQYLWADNEKVQSAWHSWIAAHDIVYSFFDKDRIYLVQQIGSDFYLLRMPLDVQISDGVPYAVHLDQRFDVTAVDTAFILPYDYLRNDELVIVQGTGCPVPGLLAPIKSIEYDPGNSGYRVTLHKSVNGGNLVCGTRYKSRFQPTMPFVKDGDGIAVGTGKLYIRRWLVSLFNTGEMIGRLLSKYGNGPEVRYNGRVVGDFDNVVGQQPLSSNEFDMPFRNNSDYAEVEFYTDSHMPGTLLTCEWQGQYVKRGRRITGGGK